MSANPLDPLGRGGAAHKPPPTHHQHAKQQHKADGEKSGDHSQLFFALHVLVLGLLIFLLVRVGVRALVARIRKLWARMFAPVAGQYNPYHQPLLQQQPRQKYE